VTGRAGLRHFQITVRVTDYGKGADCGAVRHVDNSGKPEIAVLNATTQNIGIFQASGINTGGNAFDGTFVELSGSPVATGPDPVAFATGDLNADGIDDFAV